MKDERSFLAALDEDPLDDARRLIYADWLDENALPAAAEFLRAELAVAKAPRDGAETPATRERLWRAWAAIDRRRLHEFTQPNRLRANPTPHAPFWAYNNGVGFPDVDEDCDGDPNYAALPPLPIDELLGDFAYLRADPLIEPPYSTLAERRAVMERLRSRMPLPESYVACQLEFALDEGAQFLLPGMAFLRPAWHLEGRVDEAAGATIVPFYRDHQGADRSFYLHPSGAYCVIGELGDDDLRFMAPSFEAFLYRAWIEPAIAVRRDDSFYGPGEDVDAPVTPAMIAYLDHFERRRRKR